MERIVNANIIKNIVESFVTETSHRTNEDDFCISCQIRDDLSNIYETVGYAISVAEDYKCHPNAVMSGLTMGFELGKRYAESIELERMAKK